MSLTAANQLTITRMLLIPAFVILLMYGYRGWALVTFFSAALTDLFDGFIARWTGQKTTPDIGAPNRLPLWFTVLVISRDVCIVATVAVFNLAVGRRTFRPSMFGKVATGTYIVTGVAALYFNYLNEPSQLVQALIYASLAITFISAGDYALQMTRMGH